jgi:hypothetical protein
MRIAWALLLTAAFSLHLAAQTSAPVPDSDSDGLSDALEQRLLNQFAPSFFIAASDCSAMPATFTPGIVAPTVEREDGTIYGQASPLHASAVGAGVPEVELHFYHLWRQDCGPHGHPLDAEHVAVLLQASSADWHSAIWKALYWYAGAHEQTVCDVSQIARASTLHAQNRGAQVWIAPGKHASYLDARLCHAGCGADLCERMVPLAKGPLVNLGEVGHPMNASVFASSSAWPLALKMQHTNFPAEAVARLERLPDTEIAWFHPGRHPAQGVIAISSTTEGAIGKGGAETTSSMHKADDAASNAISVAGDSTGNALGMSYRKTRHALGKSVGSVGAAIGVR